MKVNLLKK